MKAPAVTELPLEHCAEYDAAAHWCALRGLTGKVGDPLPRNMGNDGALRYINADPEAFQERVRQCAYALAMETHTTKVTP
jgi:hypothetical protein